LKVILKSCLICRRPHVSPKPSIFSVNYMEKSKYTSLAAYYSRIVRVSGLTYLKVIPFMPCIRERVWNGRVLKFSLFALAFDNLCVIYYLSGR
jgi:hypothetical protein